jgi:transcriptional regulator with XRE-family HTH domain
MGRPPGRIQDRPFQMRLSGEFLERLDEWRRQQSEPPSRAEAIRHLTTAMLQTLKNDLGETGSKPRKLLEERSTPFQSRLTFFDSEYRGHMEPSQCRAARGLLNWTQDDMASAARLSVVTVRNFENEKSTPQRATLDVMQRALAAAGVEFTNGDKPGVRLNNKALAPHGVRSASAANRMLASTAVRKAAKAGKKK